MIRKSLALFIILLVASLGTAAKTPILGTNEVTARELYDFVVRHNPDFDPEVAEAFIEVGELYGIRGDIAMCQAIVETGWFLFEGSAMEPGDHNYCGLGVHRNGVRGCEFPTVTEGVTAMIQHLYAYACKNGLPDGEELIDPRFEYVKRGSAKTWEQLAGRWAMNPNYGKRIMNLYKELLKQQR